MNTKIIPFLVLGYPTYNKSFEIIKTLIDMGFMDLKLALPFSDPNVGSNLIIEANKVALDAHISIDECFSLIEDIKNYNKDVNIVLFSYANNIIAKGVDAFMQKASISGVLSIAIADVPYFMAKDTHVNFIEKAKKHNLSLQFYIMENTKEDVVLEISKDNVSYVQFVIAKDRIKCKDALDKIKECKTLLNKHNKSLFISFSLNDKDNLKEIQSYVDGFIVSSSLIEIIKDGFYNIDKIKPKLCNFFTNIQSNFN